MRVKLKKKRKMKRAAGGWVTYSPGEVDAPEEHVSIWQSQGICTVLEEQPTKKQKTSAKRTPVDKPEPATSQPKERSTRRSEK